MANFDLKLTKRINEFVKNSETMDAGFHQVFITQVAEVGYQVGYDLDKGLVESVGVVFENTEGLQICKIMPLTVTTYSNFGKLIATVEVENELKDLLDKELILEIELDGNLPYIVGFWSATNDPMIEPIVKSYSKSIFYSGKKSSFQYRKELHPQLRRAIGGGN